MLPVDPDVVGEMESFLSYYRGLSIKYRWSLTREASLLLREGCFEGTPAGKRDRGSDGRFE